MSEHLAVSVRGLLHTYRDRVALEIPSLDVTPGECLALLGPNGAGKSTLLQILALLLRPTRGSVMLAGQVAWAPNGGSRSTGAWSGLRHAVTLVHQKPLMFSSAVQSNVAFGLRARRGDRAAIQDRVRAALNVVGLTGFERRPARGLSVGEAQRVALARALVLDTPLLLLDEPTSSLDRGSRPLVEEIIGRRIGRGTTVVIATHDETISATLGARVLRLEDGRICSS